MQSHEKIFPDKKIKKKPFLLMHFKISKKKSIFCQFLRNLSWISLWKCSKNQFRIFRFENLFNEKSSHSYTQYKRLHFQFYLIKACMEKLFLWTSDSFKATDTCTVHITLHGGIKWLVVPLKLFHVNMISTNTLLETYYVKYYP